MTPIIKLLRQNTSCYSGPQKSGSIQTWTDFCAQNKNPAKWTDSRFEHKNPSNTPK